VSERMVTNYCKECQARQEEIERLREQVQYEQERNQGNVALADREITRLREAIRVMAIRLRAVYDNESYAISVEELDAWDDMREGR
jgi:CRISPR/Cas system CSM-associated protein Csm2 small subunit